jgi:hypothetical protein
VLLQSRSFNAKTSGYVKVAKFFIFLASYARFGDLDFDFYADGQVDFTTFLHLPYTGITSSA